MSYYNNIEKNSEEKKDENQLRSFNISARKKLYSGDIEGAYKDFYYAENIYGCAYCCFIKGNIRETEILLKSIRYSSPAVEWLLTLTEIIKGEKKKVPSFLQIRNFYEADLNMLIFYKNFDFAKTICKHIVYLACYNKEIYKYTARVLIDNNEAKAAILYLQKSIDVYYRDPEVHYMLADAYLKIGEKEKAKEEYIKSNEIANGYFPAQKKLKEL